MNKRRPQDGKLNVGELPSEVYQLWLTKDDELPELPRSGSVSDLDLTEDEQLWEDRDYIVHLYDRTRLKKLEHMVLSFRFVLGMTDAEIARKIGRSRVWVRKLTEKGLLKLRKQASWMN